MTVACQALVLALLALGTLPAVSSAGTYDVYSCTLPDGKAAPTEGWSGETRGGDAYTYNGCNEIVITRGALSAAFTSYAAAGDYAGWIFTAPADTMISSYTLWRSVRSSVSNGGFQDHYLTHEVPRTLDAPYLVQFCGRYASCSELGRASGDHLAAANRVQRSGLEIKRLNAFLVCTVPEAGRCDNTPQGTHGYVAIYAARFGLSDLYPPVITSHPTGSLVQATAPVEGEKTMSFGASDRGGGIERVGIVIDGQPRLQRAADSNAARCRRPFTALKPCPAASDNTLVFDTATLPNGPQTVQASVTDAAGNETRSEPVAVTTRNGSRPNGRGASRFVRLVAWVRSQRKAQRASAVVPFGSVRTAEGRLTDASGKPIGGAVLDVASKVERPGARGQSVGTVVTRDDGRFSYRLKRGASRRLSFAYKAYTLDPAPVSTATVTLGVRAGLRVKLRPRSVRNGQKVSFRGRLLGGPGRKGTRVTIDVLVPDARRRVPIGSVRADSKGRFRFTYRFRRTLVQARYRFQARLVAQPGYPYRGATSRRVSVLVRP